MDVPRRITPKGAHERRIAPDACPPRIEEIAGHGASGEENPTRYRVDLRDALLSTMITAQNLARRVACSIYPSMPQGGRHCAPRCFRALLCFY